MEKKDYWIEFWNNNNIINKPSLHEKVGRTINGVPIEDERWNEVLSDLEHTLELNSNDDVLDIAAGCGAIAIPFSKRTKMVTALDISKKLLSEMKGIPNLKTVLADAREIDFDNESFSKIIFYFALQHFSEKESALLLQKIYKWLKPGGLCYIGDIPDLEKKFAFFNSKEREAAYFNSIIKGEPIIGTWFSKEFLEKLGSFSGFKQTSIINQPKDYQNAHYRFDVLLRK